jgi:SOS response regulatory protein OraA/RecX
MITIKTIRRSGKKFILILSNSGEIPVTANVLKKYDLMEGREFSDEIFDEMVFESDLERADRYVNYLLSRRAYTIGLIKSKLVEKGFSSRVSKNIIRNYISEGYLDDEKFAINMVESIMRRKPAGRRYILSRLRQKAVPGQIAEKAVDMVLSDIDEIESAVRLLDMRYRYFSKFDLETARRKAYNYLSRRTIGYHAAKAAFEKVFGEENQN